MGEEEPGGSAGPGALPGERAPLRGALQGENQSVCSHFTPGIHTQLPRLSKSPPVLNSEASAIMGAVRAAAEELLSNRWVSAPSRAALALYGEILEG